MCDHECSKNRILDKNKLWFQRFHHKIKVNNSHQLLSFPSNFQGKIIMLVYCVGNQNIFIEQFTKNGKTVSDLYCYA